MKSTRLFALVLMASLAGSGQELGQTFRDPFGPDDAAEFGNRWEVMGGVWQVQDGSLTGSSPSRRGFAYVPDVPEATSIEVKVSLRIVARDNPQGWCTAGVTVFIGPTDFWQLALVEGPDQKRYAELVEQAGGTWQAQRTGETALTQTANDGQWAGWEYNHDYVLTLAFSPETVEGTVADAQTGTTVTRIAHAWGQAPGVKGGRPGLVANGLRIAAQEVAARWTAAVPELGGLTIERGKLGAVAVLAGPAMGSGADVAEVATALRQGGYGVTPLTCERLVGVGVLDPLRFAALVVPDSRHFPAAGMPGLLRFLRGGGDLVLLGGLPFSEPLLQVGDEWLTKETLEAKLLGTPVRKLLFDFEQGDAQGWQRSSNHLDQPSQASLVAGPTGQALLLDIRGIDGWDTFSAPLPDGLPETDNVLCFQAQATAATPAMVVELKEEDGSRWIATVKLAAGWHPYVLPLARFEFWGDASPAGRGNPGDTVRFAQVRSLNFGLAGSHTPGVHGDHRLWIDQIGTASAAIPTPIAEPSAQLNVFNDYAAYRMADVRRVAPVPGEGSLTTALAKNVTCAGWSAVGFAFPNESVFVPLLAAEDAVGRSLGWAAGALLNHRGAYRNSAWLLCGIETAAFYRDPQFLAELPKLLAQMGSPKLFEQLRRAEQTERQASYALATPPPHEGFIRRSADGRHLVYPDGRRFFMTGCNYVGGFTRCGGRMWADDFFDAREVEDDFRKASEAGLNVMRYWLQGTLDEDIRQGHLEKVNTIRECARRHGVYLLLDLPGTGYATEEAMLASHRRIAEAFRDEPMVLGYDLRNEPYVSTLGGIQYTGTPPPVQTANLAATYPELVDMTKVDAWLKERPQWLHLPSWIQGEEARRVTVANVLWSRYTEEFGLRSSSLTGLAGKVPIGRWQPLVDVVDQSLERWLDGQLKTIREVDANHLVTVGHNTALTILPANAPLDFVSEHIYTRPFSYEHVIENITTLDRLKALWPDRPISLGEFGYSNGIALADGYLDAHTSSVGEMIHYLYAFANDYDGCKKWMLVDWPMAVMRHYGDWDRGEVTRTYEERFGLFSYDGTRSGRPKPIVPALRFFRDIVDRQAPGGTLTVTRDANPIGAGYVYRTTGALLVGGRQAELLELRFQCGDTANVMLEWDATGLRVMATADVMVEVDLQTLAPELARRKLTAKGMVAPATVEGNRWTLSLLAGKAVTLQ